MPIHLIDDDGRYLCNKACGTTESKSTGNSAKVTCRNCSYLIWKAYKEEGKIL